MQCGCYWLLILVTNLSRSMDIQIASKTFSLCVSKRSNAWSCRLSKQDEPLPAQVAITQTVRACLNKTEISSSLPPPSLLMLFSLSPPPLSQLDIYLSILDIRAIDLWTLVFRHANSYLPSPLSSLNWNWIKNMIISDSSL
jgi:hypothetical protein